MAKKTLKGKSKPPAKAETKKSKPKQKVNGALKAKTRKAAPLATAPRNRALPGMEQVRYRDLDRFCENIGDARDRKNEAIDDEKGVTPAALKAMQAHGVKNYTHAGVELLLVPGDAKLRIRRVDASGATAGEMGRTADEGDEASDLRYAHADVADAAGAE